MIVLRRRQEREPAQTGLEHGPDRWFSPRKGYGDAIVV